MKLKTKDLLKALPIDEKTRERVMQVLNGQDEAKKFELGEMIWDAGHMMYKQKLDENIRKSVNDPKGNGVKLDTDFYRQVKEKTDREFEQVLQSKTSSEDLAGVRDRLQQLMADKIN